MRCLSFNISFAICIFLFGSCTLSDQSPAQESEALLPNIVLVVTDDQGWGDLKVNGNPWLSTPVLDQLSKEGASFDRFYVSPVCAPTRASLLTGRYYLRTGTTWVTHRKEVMRSQEVTMAEVFKSAGYHTGIFGKWHNGAQYPNDPLGQGFDEFFGFCAGHWNNYFDTELSYNGNPVKTSGYINDVLTDRALEFIGNYQEQPFLCYIPYNTPHGPFQLPDQYFEKYKAMGLDDKNASVYGMCENLDDNIGRILAHLDSLELSENTIVVFLTDNGPNGERYNGGMKGWKGHIDEGGVRVPLFIRWPGHIKPGSLVKPLAAHIDLLPTLADLAGVALPEGLNLDGRSLVPLLQGSTIDWPKRNIYTVRSGAEIGPIGALRNEQYRMVLDRDQAPQLYDMLADPGQKRNLAYSLPDLTQELTATFIDWYDQVKPIDPTPPPIPVGHPQHPLTELPAPEAQLTGQLKFQGEMGWANDWITHWSQTTDSVVWSIEVAEASDFEVYLFYTCRKEDIGSEIQITIGDEVLHSSVRQAHDPEPIPSPDRVNRGEVYEKEWRRLELGHMHIPAGPQNVMVQAMKIPGAEALELKSLELRRVE